MTAPDKLHNNPPASAEHAAAIDELAAEAEPFLTGADITDAATAEAVADIIAKARKAQQAADAARKVDVKPLDEAKAAIQAVYKPILAKAERIQSVGKQLMAKWLAAEAERKSAAADKARAEAEELAERARQEMQDSRGDIEARERAEEATRVAAEAGRTANKMRRDKAGVKAGGRTMALRTVWEIEVEDATAMARAMWTTHRAEIEDFCAGLALKDVRAASGNVRLPGVRNIKREVAV